MEELVDKGKSLSTDFVQQICCIGLPMLAWEVRVMMNVCDDLFDSI